MRETTPTHEQLQSMVRIIERLERKTRWQLEAQYFDEANVSVFDERLPDWCLQTEVDAWNRFKNYNLRTSTTDSKWKPFIPTLIDEAMNENFGRKNTLCMELRKSGTTDVFSLIDKTTKKPKSRHQRQEEEDSPLVEGDYTDHHEDTYNWRSPLIRGYNHSGYGTFLQRMLEAHLNLKTDTLVPKDIYDWDKNLELMHFQFEWKERGIVFEIGCENNLHCVEGAGTGDKKQFDFYALWLIRVGNIRSD